MSAYVSMPGGWEWIMVTLFGTAIFIVPIALLVFLFIKLGRRGRWLLGSFLCAIALIPILLVGITFYGHAPAGYARNEQVSLAEVRTEENGQQTTRSLHYQQMSGSDLSNDAPLPFEPDFYASKESAVRAVLRWLATQYQKQETPSDQPLQTVYVSGHFGAIEESTFIDSLPGERSMKELVAREISQALGTGSPLTPVYPEKPMSRPADIATLPRSAISVYINVLRESGSSGQTHQTGSIQTGSIKGTLLGPRSQLYKQVEFVNKTWSEGFTLWNYRHGGSWIQGQSDRLCASEKEARSQALRQAERSVIDHVLMHFAESSRPIGDNRKTELTQWLDRVVPEWLETGRLQTDSFIQKYQRPYGTLYRGAVLVHLPSEKSNSLIEAFFLKDQAKRSSWLRTFLSGAGLFAVILAVYLFLNMATRGYYVWSVRLATVVLAVVGGWYIMTFVR